MARRKKSADTLPAEQKTADYRYTNNKRTNIPPAKIAGEGQVPHVAKVQYAYSPHLPPVLRFDPTGRADSLAELAEVATQRPLKPEEARRLREAMRVSEPQLEWAGKREQNEKGYLEVDPVALHIHERVSARAIIRAALREDVQRDLFADPQQPYQQAVQFYKHDVDWANRLILGDSLQVMSSLGRRENLAGKVQMIYMDPPYGIKFASNFQSEIGKRDVKDKEQDLTREPEMVKAYRDTWTLGVHSYLAYLRDRLLLCREMLAESGSIFVQISDENVHRVRSLMDEVFGPANFVSVITFKKTTGAGSPSGGTEVLATVGDFLVWYARDRNQVKYRQPYTTKAAFEGDLGAYTLVETPDGFRRRLTAEERESVDDLSSLGRIFRASDLTAQTAVESSTFDVTVEGRSFRPRKGGWKTSKPGMERLRAASRLIVTGDTLSYVRYLDDFPVQPLNNLWEDTTIAGFASDKSYVVQTNPKVIERCVLMTTDPGDLILDPTCGSGTTAYVAEQWGRRWITLDTSRVALSVARKRILTARYEHYQLKGRGAGSQPRSSQGSDPSRGFIYRAVPHVGLRAIVQNASLDAIFAKHQPVLNAALDRLNRALREVPTTLRAHLKSKLAQKEAREGKRAITEADRRRWLLPVDRWKEWEVPFESDEEWPAVLRAALADYRSAWRAKMIEVNDSIAANAQQVELVNEPEKVRGVVRVSGPFTVEGVRPEELNLGEEGLFDGSPNAFDTDEDGVEQTAQQNLHAYLDRMVQYIRKDGVTFLGNNHRKFAQVEALFETGTGAVLHAEGAWADAVNDDFTVAIGFGPQYGPVTALQVEDLIHASKQYDELVIAGFSFDAAATAIIQEQSNPRLRVHQAYIRPDVNPGMEGLLKETPNSQLFTVFGTPEITVRPTEGGEWSVTLEGVDIYDPVTNTVQSAGADKVAAWFLDSDFDGRCFCITQAFFPRQDAWEKIAKALGSSADAEAFETFKGTESVPFPTGKYKRIAVKVIDPRGNEVMAVRSLES
jgi:adenine-specific DNA-methyltransferase